MNNLNNPNNLWYVEMGMDPELESVVAYLITPKGDRLVFSPDIGRINDMAKRMNAKRQ